MKALIVAKHSKLEWDSINSGETLDKVLKKYEDAGANTNAIFAAHQHQVAARGWMKKYLQRANTVFLNEWELVAGPCDKEDLIISLGGDNSFTRVSHFLSSTTPLLGVNSDPARSVGWLCSWNMTDEGHAAALAEKLSKHEYEIEEWHRLEVTINGVLRMRPALSELFLGERLRKNMSRHILQLINAKRYTDFPPQEHKSSGLIVATGAGSTGWLKSASQWKPWLPTREEARYIATEAYNAKDWTQVSDHLLNGETLKVTSLNDDGIVSVDSWEERTFNRGTVAEIKLGTPLKVMKC